MKWTVENMKRKVDGDVVTTVAYRVVAKQGGLIADHRGKVDLPHKNPTTKTFIKFEELTEVQVLDWVKSNVDVAAIEVQVQEILNRKIATVAAKETVTGLPWKNKI
jgi:hypothetical protein